MKTRMGNIDASPTNPRVIEIDAHVISAILRKAGKCKKKRLVKTANLLCEYFVDCMENAKPFRN